LARFFKLIFYSVLSFAIKLLTLERCYFFHLPLRGVIPDVGWSSISVSPPQISGTRWWPEWCVLLFVVFFFFLLFYLIFILALKKKSNQSLGFVIVKVSSLFSSLQFLKFKIIYGIKGFFQFHWVYRVCIVLIFFLQWKI